MRLHRKAALFLQILLRILRSEYDCMRLNQTFISNIQDIYGKDGKLWLQSLPKQLVQLSSLWNFHLIKTMPDLSYNFVGLVKLHSSLKTAILKIAPKEGNLGREIKWLQCIEKGAPKVYQVGDKLNVYLMEYLKPGKPLKRLVQEGHDDAATRIICQTIGKLQFHQRCEGGFPHLSELAKDFSILSGKFDARLLSQAISWFKELTMNRAGDLTLHGDLHHDNILSSGEDWKVIDPHGYIGDPIAEVGAMIRNPMDCFPHHHSLPSIVERRLKIMAEELSFDPKKVKQWAFCMTVLSAAWSLEDHGKVLELETKIAAAINQTPV